MIRSYRNWKLHKTFKSYDLSKQSDINKVCKHYWVDVERIRKAMPGCDFNPELLDLRMKGITLQSY